MRAILTSLLLCGLAMPALAQGDIKRPGPAQPAQPARPEPAPERNLEVTNSTDTVIREVYVYTLGGPQGPDRLGAAVLPVGRNFSLRLGRVAECRQVMRIVWQDESEETRPVDVCATRSLALTDDNRRDIALRNDTDATLMQVFIFARGTPDAGPDRLGRATVAPGGEFRLRLRGFQACEVTVRAAFQGLPAETREADICARPQLAFGDPNVPLREVQVTNRSGVALQSIYATTQPGTNWGPDRLGADVLAAGASFAMRMRTGECRARIRAVFQNRREELREGVDLCAAQPIIFHGQRRLALGNLYERPIAGIYLSAVEEGDWGANQISAPLTRNGTAEISTDGGCRADLRIVFDNESAEELRNFDICRHQAITLRPGWVTEARE
ncbi:MAG: hypothetical protein NTW56_03480 [Alphaproteobacteria bacterium]|nr:hypothetical protein [Alphaproteobacteria bacterium]